MSDNTIFQSSGNNEEDLKKDSLTKLIAELRQYIRAVFFGRNYCNFKGRASRKEFWTAFLFSHIYAITVSYVFFRGASIVTGIAFEDLLINTPKTLGNAFSVMGLFLWDIPLIFLAVRRMHDCDLSGYWLLTGAPFFLVPFWKGDRRNNRFGQNIYNQTEEEATILPADAGCGQILLTDLFGNNFMQLNGRSGRKEFWLIGIIFPLCYYLLFTHYPDNAGLGTILLLAFLFILPVFSVFIRRFHDLNMNGCWIFYIIPILILPFVKGKDESNKYGESIYKKP